MSVRVTRLPSGLTIASHRMPELKSAALGIWVGAGARDERADEHGVSHMLEHMAFKGTRRRTARRIAEEIEAVGGDLNAATSVESTAYFAHVLAPDVGLGIDILSDILTESTFEPAELAREQGVVLQEIGAANDTPDDVVYDLTQEIAFPGQPIGRCILGTPDSVRAIDRARLTSYLERHYRTGHMVVSAAGAIDHDQLVDEAAARLETLARGAAPDPAPAVWSGGTRIDARDLEQAHLIVALEGVSYHDPGYYALQTFTNAVGGGMSSRLFQEVREVRGLAYSIYSFHWPYGDTGLFGVYAGTDEGDSSELMRVIQHELVEASASLSEAEIARAKAQMKAGLLMAMERPVSRAEQIARHILINGRPLDLDEIVARIDALTVSDVRTAGVQLLARGRPAFAGVGPRRGVEAAAKIATSFKTSAS